MANSLPTISPFVTSTNPSEAWRFWKQDFEDYLEAIKYSDEGETTKTALFRHVCGEELKKQLRAFDLKPAVGTEQVSLQQILEEFDKYFLDYQNEVYASFKFLEIKQERGETFSNFYSRLRSAVVECSYGTSQDRMLRDKIIHGLLDKPLQERLLRETSKKDKTLLDLISECKAAEHSKAQVTEMNDNRNVNSITKPKHRPKTVPFSQVNSSRDLKKSCRCCGLLHESRKCPAYGSKCLKCGGRNHWATVCKTKLKHRDRNSHSKNVNTLEEKDSEVVYIGELKSLHELNSENCDSTWFQKLKVNNNSVIFKLDTGSQVNVIPKSELLKWKEKPVVRKNYLPVLDYSDNVVPIIGECYLKCKTDKFENDFKFLVTSLDSCPILGLDACKNLGLIQRLNLINKNCKLSEMPQKILSEYSDVFSGSGLINKTVHIKLKPNCSPHVAAPRKIPLALHDKVREELSRMVETGIITKVNEPTEWVSNMVVVNKPKKLRICLDPRPLNEAIQRPHYQIPTADSLISKLQGCKVFTIFDAKNGFWQLPLDKESSYLTTFTTPWGRYRFLVLPFGLNNAPEEFQRAMDEIFENEDQINPYFDDIALGSSSLEEHCRLLRRTLEIARKANLKFNIDKTQLSLTSVSYLGHLLSDKGIEPDPNKVRAINEFAVPKSKEDLQRFLGMITYLAKFTPHLSNLTHSLRQLLKKDVDWFWDSNCQKDFELLKDTIAKAPCLQYFNENKTLTVSVDASKNGLGATLLQEGKPVAYGSASLTETQQRYAQIEKELLAVVYGLEHYNYYTYGRPVIVQTDHKPLLGLSKKPYDSISPRLQRLLLRLNRYDIQLDYVPGKKLLIADTLSRAQSPTEIFDEGESPDSFANISLLTQASPGKWTELATLTANDDELKDVQYHIKNGWPEKSKTRLGAKAYWHCKEELYFTNDGIVCRGQRLVVPTAGRDDILKTLHISHRGIVLTKAKAREYFYWPNINKDVENFIQKCKICQKYQRENQQEMLVDVDLPERPWQKVSCDFYYLKQQQNLLMIDHFSKYVELKPVKSITAQAIIPVMKSIFATHGIPEEFISDGGPPFNSYEVKKFFEKWKVLHHTTSPHFPRANGQIERTVQSIKNSLRKAEEDGRDIYEVLLDYRIQPAKDLPSPAELLMGRRLRSFLPAHATRLTPNFDTQETQKMLRERQLIQNKYANRKGTRLPGLVKNARVWFRHKMKKPWKQGTIVQIGPQPRSYLIKGKDGGFYRRNRYHIRPDLSQDNKTSTTVEDFYPSFNSVKYSDSSTNNDNSAGSDGKQTASPVLRRSTRNIVKPLRYR